MSDAEASNYRINNLIGLQIMINLTMKYNLSAIIRKKISQLYYRQDKTVYPTTKCYQFIRESISKRDIQYYNIFSFRCLYSLTFWRKVYR